ncbi:MAG: AAA family ATPase [Polyangiaceae bacterium]|nr:AAA family ATPase [Polyangiaceae bacterium]
MLESLHLKNVGPAPEMKMDLAPRLNLITGDNGLGKTLLLDSAWWALTSTWPATWGGKGVVPEKEDARIEWTERRNDIEIEFEGHYNFDDSYWKQTDGPPNTTRYEERIRSRQQGPPVIYLRVDGGISIYDPLRVGEDFRFPFGQKAWGRSNAFQFREPDIWDGLSRDGEKSFVCEGLVRDVGRWAVEKENPDFELLTKLVQQLSGEERFRLTDKVGRVYVDDPRDYPVLTGPAGDIPAAHAPAGLRRILGLAYLVVWARREHRVAAGLKKIPPSSSLVLLIDEMESHLHPKWQRTILPSLLRALGADVELQVVATTHAPLVLASVESSFDARCDAWFDLDLDSNASPPRVKLEKRPYIRRGEVGNWLASEAFDLKEPRSLEGERAVRAAHDILSAKNPSIEQIEAIDKQLREAGLPDIDRFWVRWDYFVEQARNAAAEKNP